MKKIKGFIISLFLLCLLGACSEQLPTIPSDNSDKRETPANPSEPISPDEPALPLIIGSIQGSIRQFAGASLKYSQPSKPKLSLDARSQKVNQDLSELLKKAETTETLRVIVTLATSTGFTEEAFLENLSLIPAQRNAIRFSQQTVLSSLIGLNVTELEQFTTLPLLVLQLDKTSLDVLRGHPNVALIHEDKPLFVSLKESVPIVNAPQAWQEGYDGSGWTVAVIDTGVEKDHPLLRDKIVAEACFSVSDPAESLVTTCPNKQTSQIGMGAAIPCSRDAFGCFHGTHVAGIAVGNSGEVSGVAKGAKLIAVQVFHYNTNPFTCFLAGTQAPCISTFESSIIRALEYVYSIKEQYPIAAVNLSVGGEYSATACDLRPVALALSNLRAAGIAPVAASGNNGFTQGLSMPACASGAISVGSSSDGSLLDGQIQLEDSVSEFSNSAAFLDLLAPGEAIRSAALGDTYLTASGTSMAAPHVAGAWAILKQKYPDASVNTLLYALIASGKPLIDIKNGFAKPRIDLAAVLAEEIISPLVVQLLEVKTGTILRQTTADFANSFVFNAIPEGRYYLRVFIDANHNNKPDPGEMTGFFGSSAKPEEIIVSLSETSHRVEVVIGMPFEIEENDTFETANVLTSDGFIHGLATIDKQQFDENDYFRLIITETGFYTIETLGKGCVWLLDENADTRLSLFDSQENLLAHNDDISFWELNFCSRVNYHFTVPGVYYVLVQGNDETAGQPYILSLHKDKP